MYPIQRQDQTQATVLTLDDLIKSPHNYTFTKCENLLKELQFFEKNENLLPIYLVHDRCLGYTGDFNIIRC